MLPKISIITVVRNDPKGLELTLSNIKQFDYTNLELVLIDGASTDSTMDVAMSHKELLNVVVSEPDKGLYDAMNKGLVRSTGDYVWFVNAGDTICCSGEDLARVFGDSDSLWSDIAIVYGDTKVVDQAGNALGLRRKKLPVLLNQRSFLRGMVVCHQSIIISRHIAPMYDTMYRFSADVEWVQSSIESAVANGMKIVNSGLILSCFAEGGMTTQNRKKSLIERFHIMRQHYGLLRTIGSHAGFVVDSFFKSGYRNM